MVAADGLSLGGTSESPPPVAPIGGGLQAEPAPFDVDVGLWDGRDDSEGEHLSYDLRPNASSTARARTSAEESAKVFVILGPQDSGTNLLSTLIVNNFAGLKSSHCVSHSECLWKHSLAGGAANIYEEAPEKLKPQKIEETSAVMVVRSPLSQIVSWKNMPYDMDRCVSRPYERMNESCSALGDSFNSTVEIYNHYVQQYRQIHAVGKFMNAHLFSYEDMVYSTEEVIHVLAMLLGKPMPDVMYTGERSAKEGGSGRMQAKAKIENRLYLNGISTPQQAILCQGLDYERADMIVEGSYLAKGDPKRKTHSYDCRAHRPR